MFICDTSEFLSATIHSGMGTDYVLVPGMEDIRQGAALKGTKATFEVWDQNGCKRLLETAPARQKPPPGSIVW